MIEIILTHISSEFLPLVIDETLGKISPVALTAFLPFTTRLISPPSSWVKHHIFALGKNSYSRRHTRDPQFQTLSRIFLVHLDVINYSQYFFCLSSSRSFCRQWNFQKFVKIWLSLQIWI